MLIINKLNKMRDKTVSILLSTFNGANYISEQLDSLINQTYREWKLYIRDDGSSDDTLKIIRLYAERDARINIISDSKLHRGPNDSFIWLLSKVQSDYYMFCDQDDFWIDIKIEESIKSVLKYEEDRAVIGCCDLFLVDKNLRIINQSMWKTHHLSTLVDNPDGIRIASMFPGCTMIFNNAAKNIALTEKFKFPMHDIHLSMSVKKNDGKIIAIHEPLIKYRLHGHNVVGLYSGSNWFFNKISNIMQCWKNNLSYYSLSSSYLGTSLFQFCYLKLKHLFNLI